MQHIHVLTHNMAMTDTLRVLPTYNSFLLLHPTLTAGVDVPAGFSGVNEKEKKRGQSDVSLWSTPGITLLTSTVLTPKSQGILGPKGASVREGLREKGCKGCRTSAPLKGSSI